MGCVNSKKISCSCQSPPYEEQDVCFTSCAGGRRLSAAASPLRRVETASGPLEKLKVDAVKEVEVVVKLKVESEGKRIDSDCGWEILRDESKGGASQKKGDVSIRVGRWSESELEAAGWPAWLCSVAADTIEGWLPLRSDAYERLDKIGQGTYSNVYRARDLKTNKIVAVKKVRFDNFQAESVRFMAREIKILRMLDHPNVMKLEGIITSRLSCTIYLVFEYMEHDLAGLLSCPDIKFTESQIKCYMKQLLSGLDHCHSRGIMHRDIKSSNILVNNDGVLEIADLGLAYFTKPKNRHPLTSRVVTLWYRPTELLLGSTNYGGEVDLWSVGCVFAELFLGRPILKGRTEVEQLHKIFRLCGTPPDEYWRTTRLPLAAMFKPQHPYESTLRERCRELPKTAVDLIETLLSIEPHKRGTAASALQSQYFSSRPHACEPSSMPNYPPNKEMDARAREDERRIKSISARPEAVSTNIRKPHKTLQAEEVDVKARRNTRGGAIQYKRRSSNIAQSKQSFDTKSDISVASNATQDSITSTKSDPLQMPPSTGFAWARRQKQDARLHALRNQKSLEPSYRNRASTHCEDDDDAAVLVNGAEASKIPTRAHLLRPSSFDSVGSYELPRVI